ncbi:hypothetical protein BSPLISOX_2026 [uncultured Gammaproteobacteria bacterium]|jgi:outer membrane biogenesis lipoprotein LolB|nr:hypothetical protein [uncultured Gammaproteobacteria bacterium]CAC9435484.1 hypothetical protein [uncultured Gammaproteobacteria bacterium]CAC9435851.1 hypothetical protein [uncultured Gammaproteobacteria bacterium]CAC9436361.1 hypothetical protein [uncultured Gammaproteobacteria bacterium]CAC9447804.1 hypothetical protein [uncultured Gammaproteobacteria bacterium]
MKTLVLLLLFGFLSACSTIPEHSEPLVYSNSIPSVWTIAGQLSVMRNKKTDTVSFEFSQQSGYYQLTFSGSFGLGQRQIKQTEQGLLIDDKLTLLTLEQWMKLELGWYFPVETLEDIVFIGDDNKNQDWQISTSRHRVFKGIAYPKIIRLTHPDKHIKIKLLLQEVNRLK